MAAVFAFCRKYMQIFGGMGTIGLTLAYGIPHTVGLSKYQLFTALYPDGIEATLDDHTKDLYQQVHNKILLKPKEEAMMTAYVCYGQDPIHMGSTSLKTGSILGLPLNFSYKSVDDISRKKLRLGPESSAIKWDTTAGKQFAQSLILSDDAKLFAIAREIKSLDSLYVYTNTSYVGFYGLTTYWAGHALNQMFGLPQRTTVMFRCGMYGAILALGYVVFITLKDASQARLDRRVDKRAAELGKNYAKGGVEYYEKVLKRNLALRELFGEKGETMYTAYGNTVQSWRLPSMTITSRLDRLKEILANYEKTENSTDNELLDAETLKQ